MTFEEACAALGYDELPDVAEESRETIVKTVIRLTENGAKPLDHRMANLCRAQIEEFG